MPCCMRALAVDALNLLTDATTSFVMLGAFAAHRFPGADVGFVSIALAIEALPNLTLRHIPFGIVVSVRSSESIVDEAVCIIRGFHEYDD